MLSVADALAKITDGVAELPAEQVPISEAHGRVLAEDLAARISHPPVAVSAMDGYAVRWADLNNMPAALTVIGESAAGHVFDGVAGEGQAVRIFTGAGVPEGSDTIVIQEDTERDGDTVRVLEKPGRKGEYVRKAGMDFTVGDRLLTKGRVLTARDVGLAAAMNHAWVVVRRQPRIAYAATGDEVVMPGATLEPGQIVSSNSLAFAAYVTAMGGIPVSLGIARDEEASLSDILKGARGVDMLVTMGGASVGDHDLVQKALGGNGFALSFYRIAMRPGKPLIFGHVGETPFLGLPGNPVSTGVTSALFLRAAMMRMLDVDGVELMVDGVLGCDVPANGKREDYMRSALAQSTDGKLVATPFSAQDSAKMAAFARADGLVIRAPHAPASKAGDAVKVLPLGFGRQNF